MMRGPKPVDKGNVTALPLHEEPQAVHFARAEALLPPGLRPEEAVVWMRIAPQLCLLGRLKPHFVDALMEYCVVRVRLAEARRYLDKADWEYVTFGRNGKQHKMRPQVAQLNEDWRKWRSLVGEFGLAPAAERGTVSGQGDIFDDFEKF